MLDFGNQSLKHAITSLVSVVSSTLRGVEYLTYGGKYVVIEKIVKVKCGLFQYSEILFFALDLERVRKWKCNSKVLFSYFAEVFY
jgi:hypothetical protein